MYLQNTVVFKKEQTIQQVPTQVNLSDRMLSERGARHKNVSTVWFCLSEVQEWKKIIYTDKTGKAVTSGKESEGTFWKLEKLHVLI